MNKFINDSSVLSNIVEITKNYNNGLKLRIYPQEIIRNLDEFNDNFSSSFTPYTTSNLFIQFFHNEYKALNSNPKVVDPIDEFNRKFKHYALLS